MLLIKFSVLLVMVSSRVSGLVSLLICSLEIYHSALTANRRILLIEVCILFFAVLLAVDRTSQPYSRVGM